MSLGLESLRSGVALADGGWSTLLRARGADDVPSEAVSVAAPQFVEALAREYVAAGVQFLSTHTFAANRFAWARYAGRSDGPADLIAVNKAAVKIARKAARDSETLIAGTIGPSGRILAVREATEEELAAGFIEQARALASAGVDLFLLETFSELSEILVALRAVKEAADKPVIASLSFDSGPQRTRTLAGVEAAEAAAALSEAGADLIGCNCGAGVAHALPAVVALRGNTSRPIWVKPSAGVPDLDDGRPVYSTTPDEFVSQVSTLIEAGANVIGGCCGVGPEHIRKLAGLVEGRRRTARRRRG